ncbi:unnamed protein product [Ostreobium quekettii]|uniref:monodehydroascorbate reductase (NADH) n=1 Tax=Ostreobium quekettii TaxID=121088 RepID=A0A8S1IJQ9_9CHLO|nr:unnamed protein product [Ostreobium quekettii]CAD7699654.1 unnamed protein product [Ostreobium quekettii]|eukprot:evm.model.scf_547EXC.3 EVM.evm.TU.scf_547EXC.3   scf_547EXC:23501-25594(-)
MRSFRFVLLGGGLSSGYAAREFVKRGLGPGQLCIVTAEDVVAYERPALSKGYLNPVNAARLPGFHTCVGGGGPRQEPAWYAEHGVEYLTGATVTSVDISSRRLVLDNGEELTYTDKLIVATGARPARLEEVGIPGWDLKGVYYLRDIKDAVEIQAGIAECKARDGNALVIGAGYIAIEVAAGLCANGLHTTMVFPGGMLMDRMLPPEAACFYENYYERKGIEMCWGQRVTRLLGSDGLLEGVELDDGRVVEASMVLAGIGARINKELFVGQLDMSQGGIEVNGKFRTSHPDVYAVGDVAAFPLLRYGGYIQRQEHVTNARASAIHAVAAIMDPENTGDYDYLPFYYSRFFSLSWQFFGLNRGRGIMFGDQDMEKFGLYFVEEGRIVGAFLEGGSAEEFGWMKAVALQRPVAPHADDLVIKGLKYAQELATKPSEAS